MARGGGCGASIRGNKRSIYEVEVGSSLMTRITSKIAEPMDNNIIENIEHDIITLTK